ncbi:MAG: thioredoxin-disulfide reductase [Elusimicrobiota bacterium]|jgi:thioredoxin reductase (NADPH)|nr:thioredoxin-disulfide reductase [Elusimicrobiota bacterium]
MTNQYDVIIVGGGPAGLSAAIYSARAKLKTLLIESAACGGHLIITDRIENYPGFPQGINGFDLAMQLEDQAKEFGAEIIIDEIVEVRDGAVKTITTTTNVYKAAAVIVAAGTQVKQLNVPGEREFVGKGVSYCAVCDAPFFRGKAVAVIGGGDSALQEAIYLTKFAGRVTIIHRRDKLRAGKSLVDKFLSLPNAEIIYNATIDAIAGADKVNKAVIKNLEGVKSDLLVDGVFVFIGLVPNSGLFSFLALDENGYIITDENMKTSKKGFFACGDIRKKSLRQIVTAASDGAIAAMSVEKYVEEL